ncbi:glycosyltransferase family 1 protein [Bacillus sp. DJP31]|uniref:glycosyltransferase family 1 protein n=1 Tax=Bacillus sp. DJP31 TaxID=3409789 RepID=UPI003BB5BC51
MLAPIRVLQVFAEMNRGGAETMIMNLYRNINRSKVQFDFIVHTEDKCDYDDEIKLLGGKVYRMPQYKGKNHVQYKRSWKNFLTQYPEYKIIHGHVRSTAAIYLGIAKKHGLTTIAHSHNTSSGTGFSAFVKNVMQFPIRLTADYLFSCSKKAGIWLYGKRACTGDNFYILNNAIETKKFIYNQETRLQKRKELHLEDKFVIGHIGRFHPQKNHDFIIEIFKEVYDRKKDVVLLLIGDGMLRQSIEKKVNDLSLSQNVIFTGVIPDIPELLQAMDIFLFPSLYEGLPVTLVEAQASGLKILASDTITQEVSFTSSLEYFSLNASTSDWAKSILRSSEGYKRGNMLFNIKKAKYDVVDSSVWLENFYIKTSNTNNKGVNNG